MDYVHFMRTVIAVSVTVIVAALFPSLAAAKENPTVSVNVKASKLYREVAKPAKLWLGIKLNPEPGYTEVLPYKKVRISLPEDLNFNPAATKPCPDSRVNIYTNTAAGTDALAALCPRSIVGNGTAELYLARGNSGAPNLTDPELIVFNAGTRNGMARIKIVGYSRTANAGMYMDGHLNRNRKLVMDVPVLSHDSSVGILNLNFPGKDHSNRKIRGITGSYVKATCSTGSWTTKANFQFGRRTAPSGISFGEEYWLTSPPSTQKCFGAKGHARNKVRVETPHRVKRGKRAVKVTVINHGTATAKRTRAVIRVQGKKRKVRVPALRPGARRTVKSRFLFRKGIAKVTVRIPGSSARTMVRVR